MASGNSSGERLAEELAEYSTAVVGMLNAATTLAEYHGGKADSKSFVRATARPLYYAAAIPDWTVRASFGPQGHKYNPGARSAKLVRVVSPLFEVLSQAAWFVGSLRAGGEEMYQGLLNYGDYVGTLYVDLTGPMWEAFPEYAPEGWVEGHAEAKKEYRGKRGPKLR